MRLGDIVIILPNTIHGGREQSSEQTAEQYPDKGTDHHADRQKDQNGAEEVCAGGIAFIDRPDDAENQIHDRDTRQNDPQNITAHRRDFGRGLHIKIVILRIVLHRRCKPGIGRLVK